MSNRSWTEAQRRAIEDEGGALLVSAAAGSGKTAVLVERAARLLCRETAPVAADRLLLLTFTNAAAEELRGRIGLRLEEEIRRRPDDAALRRQRMALKKAFIGTIDAFCLALVKEHFAALELPPDLAVGEPAVLAQLADMALAETMETMYADEDFAGFATLYGRARSDMDAQREVLRLYDFTRTLPDPAAQLAHFTAMYDAANLATSAWGEQLFAFAEKALAAAGRALSQALALARAAQAEVGSCLPALEAWQAAVAGLEQWVQKRDWDSARAFSQDFAAPVMRFPRGCEAPEKERIKTLRDRAKREWEDLKSSCFVCSEAEYRADLAAAKPMVAALCRAAELYGEKFWQAKLEERAFEFSDFEHLALALLGGAGGRSPLADQLAERYDAVMVDEYQDTNELQSALYQRLGAAGGENLFYVGDVKQSIYRFRKANPGIFLEKRRNWGRNAPGVHPTVVTLGHNFRSSSGVIAGVNFFFSALMSRELGEVDYDENERLIAGLPGDAAAGGGAAVELLLCEGPAKAADAPALAQRIRAMVEEGLPVRDKNALRPCGYGDFCILLRARANMAVYVAALEAAGLPVAADTSESLLEAAEVLPLTAALAAIDNPGDDVNLAAALVGPIFHLSTDALARLRAASPKGSLWGALVRSDEPESRDVLAALRAYRALAGSMHAGRLCEEIVTRSGYLSALAAMEGGEARRANLQRFITWAGKTAANGRGGLGGFVRLLSAGRGPEDAGARTLPGHVAVMTIHRSKGLEFPVCILADADHNFNQTDLRARVQLHAALGIGLALRSGDAVYPTLPQLAIRHRAQPEMQSEEMRILYVALTRARDRLLISLSTADAANLLQKRAAELGENGPDGWQLARRLSHGDWLLAAALCHPDAEPLRARAGLGGLPLLPAEGALHTEVLQPQQAEPGENAAPTLTAHPDEALQKSLQQAFGRAAPRAGLRKMPAKISVTALAKADLPAPLARPSFMYKSGLTAAERGSAMHAFLQFANYTAAGKDLEGEILRLVAQGYLAAEAAAMLDRAGIQGFFASALYGRMRQAAQLLREYDFITALPAGDVEAGLAPREAEEPVMVQGIADAVLVWGSHAEIADYKTDRNLSAEELAARYQTQLALYRRAVEKRLGLPVTKLTLWSFWLNCEVDVPLEAPGGEP